MKVNPSYKKIELPRAEWPLLDDYIPDDREHVPAGEPGGLLHPARRAGHHAAQDRRGAARRLAQRADQVRLRRWSTDRYKIGRIDRQAFGARFMLGVVSLGDVERYGLRSAALETKRGAYVAPERRLARRRGRRWPSRRRTASRSSSTRATCAGPGKAYPGTMVVYTAAQTRQPARPRTPPRSPSSSGSSTTEGQRPGTGNGELPAGFLPDQEDRRDREAATPRRRRSPRRSRSRRPCPAEAPATSTPPPGGSGGTPATRCRPRPRRGRRPLGHGRPRPERRADRAGGSPSRSRCPRPRRSARTSAAGCSRALLVIGLLGIAVASAVRFFVQPPPGPRP